MLILTLTLSAILMGFVALILTHPDAWQEQRAEAWLSIVTLLIGLIGGWAARDATEVRHDTDTQV